MPDATTGLSAEGLIRWTSAPAPGGRGPTGLLGIRGGTALAREARGTARATGASSPDLDGVEVALDRDGTECF